MNTNMQNCTSFSMIKPDAVKNNNQGLIIDRILQAGFKIIAMKICHLSRKDAENFYYIHKERPFFESLINFMVSGPVIALVIKQNNAVEEFRNLIGPTNPLEAPKGTIRADFAQSIEQNAIHGSDTNENAKNEIAFFFSSFEILN